MPASLKTPVRWIPAGATSKTIMRDYIEAMAGFEKPRRGGRHAAERLIPGEHLHAQHAQEAGNREEESAGSSDWRSRLPL
jgi:hypothetical protein